MALAKWQPRPWDKVERHGDEAQQEEATLGDQTPENGADGEQEKGARYAGPARFSPGAKLFGSVNMRGSWKRNGRPEGEDQAENRDENMCSIICADQVNPCLQQRPPGNREEQGQEWPVWARPH